MAEIKVKNSASQVARLLLNESLDNTFDKKGFVFMASSSHQVHLVGIMWQ